MNQDENMKRRYILIMICILLVISEVLISLQQKQMMKNSVFSWHDDFKDAEHPMVMTDLCEKYHIDTVYQYATPKDLSSEAFSEYAQILSEAGIQTVLIYDEPEYSVDGFKGYLKAVRASAAAQNVTGIIVDIEPFSGGQKTSVSALKEYTGYMQKYSDTAHAYGLKYMIAIPTWYDELSQELTAQLIQSADRIVLMNYTTKDFLRPIRYEVKTAREMGVEVEDAAELQPVCSQRGITPDMTYAGQKISVVIRDLNRIDRTYGNMRGCFHHFRDLYRMT